MEEDSKILWAVETNATFRRKLCFYGACICLRSFHMLECEKSEECFCKAGKGEWQVTMCV